MFDFWSSWETTSGLVSGLDSVIIDGKANKDTRYLGDLTQYPSLLLYTLSTTIYDWTYHLFNYNSSSTDTNAQSLLLKEEPHHHPIVMAHNKNETPKSINKGGTYKKV